MKVKFVGAAGLVTGSCTLLHYPRTGIQFLVDCGLVQGEPNAAALNTEPWPFNASRLSFVLLTHAHLDHCGLIPRLYREGFCGKVICTRFTGALAALNLEDAVKHGGVPFTKEDVRRIRFDYIDDRDEFGFSRRLAIADDLFASFLRSAHIGGACGITVSWMIQDDQWSEITFSGDIGNNTKGNGYQSLLSHRQSPFGFPRHMVLESTYGDRQRDAEFRSYEKRIEKLSSVIRSAIYQRKGPLVIPCFSIHRTQEVLVDLHVVLDQVLAKTVAEGRPLLRTPEAVELVILNGLQVKHVEGKKSLISHWPAETQTEWLNWFVRADGEGNNTESVLLPRDRSPSTLDIVREKLRMLRKKSATPTTVVLDSPLAARMCEVYAREMKRRQRKSPDEPMYRNRDLTNRLALASEQDLDDFLDKLFSGKNGETAFAAYNLRFASGLKRSGRESSGANTIVVTGGGMCEGGPVIEHLKAVLTDEDATVLLTGYAPQQSLAGKLRQLPGLPIQLRETETLDIFGTEIPCQEIVAEIADIGPYYSGHADQAGLIDFLLEVRAKPEIQRHPCRVFLNHGDDRKRRQLADAIRIVSAQDTAVERRVLSGIEIPSNGSSWFDLTADKWDDESSIDGTLEAVDVMRQVLAEQRRTNELLSQLVKVLATGQQES